MEIIVPKQYEVFFRFCDNNKDTLVVTCTPNNSFALFKYNFDRPTLFIRDKCHLYYTYNPGSLTGVIKQLIYKYEFKKVLYLGSSKGATGSLILSAVGAKMMPDRTFYNLAFAPQTLLWPENPNLIHMPSYSRMMKNSKIRPNILINLNRYGNIGKWLDQNNLLSTIIYNENYKMDAIEASHVQAWNIRKIPLPFGFHGTLLYYTTDFSDENAVCNLVDKLYIKREKDKDLKITLPDSKQKLIEELRKMNWLPSLKSFVDDTFNIKFN